MKDILNSISIKLRNQTNSMSLKFGKLGKLILDKQVRFVFASTVKLDINKAKARFEKVPSLSCLVLPLDYPSKEVLSSIDAKQEQPILSPSTEMPQIPQSADSTDPALNLVEEEVLKTGEALKQLQIATSRLAEVEKLLDDRLCVDENSGSSHNHHYTGDRLWKDGICPICRAKESEFVSLKDKRKLADLESDKIQLHVSLQIDNDYFNKKQREMDNKRQLAEEIAETNRKKAIEKKTEYAALGILPVGDVLDKRKVRNSPADSWKELSNALREQVMKR
jgi:hypothetical protein